MDPKELSVEYDRIYKEAEDLFERYNPCQFERNLCIRNRREQETGRFKSDSTVTKNGCCDIISCKRLTPKGCSVKALGCKLYVCSALLWREHKEFLIGIVSLTKKAQDMLGPNITQCYTTKEKFRWEGVINESKRVVSGVRPSL